MSNTLTNEQRVELEILVDRADLAGVLDALATICQEKSEHVATVWQDKPLARTWQKAAAKLERFVRTSEIQGAGK